MGQKLFTKSYGEIEVECSWVEGPHHLARLTNGAYVHITGLPVNSKSELRAVLTGEDLEKALDWFDHRHDGKEQVFKRVMFDADGAPIFEDGTPVESPSDLVQALKPGPVLDAALMALSKKLEEKRRAENLAQKEAGSVAKGMKARKLAGPKKPPQAVTAKTPAPPSDKEAVSITV
jgi:hypothetical protein